MASTASTINKNSFSFCGERVRNSDGRCGGTRLRCISVGLERGGAVCLFVFLLLRELLRCRTGPVVDLTLRAEIDHAGHNDCDREDRNGPTPDFALKAAIEKGHEEQTTRDQTWNHDYAHNNGRSFPELQPLEHRQVIPFGPWKEMRIGWIGNRSQRDGAEVRKSSERSNDH